MMINAKNPFNLQEYQKELTKFLGDHSINVKSIEPYIVAFTHRSFAHEVYAQEKPSVFNQRLEFLGDAILGAAVGDLLYRQNPDWEEGALTQTKAGIVCESTLHELAVKLNLGKYILLGKGEEASGGKSRPSILADALEAFIGAIYIDQGFTQALAFVTREFAVFLKNRRSIAKNDYKSELQILLSRWKKPKPEYRIIGHSGPDHERKWKVALFVEGKKVSEAIAKSRKKAEQNAADSYLQKIRNNLQD